MSTGAALALISLVALAVLAALVAPRVRARAAAAWRPRLLITAPHDLATSAEDEVADPCTGAAAATLAAAAREAGWAVTLLAGSQYPEFTRRQLDYNREAVWGTAYGRAVDRALATASAHVDVHGYRDSMSGVWGGKTRPGALVLLPVERNALLREFEAAAVRLGQPVDVLAGAETNALVVRARERGVPAMLLELPYRRAARGRVSGSPCAPFAPVPGTVAAAAAALRSALAHPRLGEQHESGLRTEPVATRQAA